MGLPDPNGERSSVRDEFLTPILNETPIWRDLYENVRERMFPPKLPPLELTSQPVPVPDRMATNTNPWAVGTATLVNGGLLALLLLMGVRAVLPTPKQGPMSKFKLDDFPLFASRADPAHGGGGGGANDAIDAIRGRNPKLDMHPLAPVQIPILDHPRLAVDNSVAVPPEIKLPENPTLANIGMHSSPNVTIVSGGTGGYTGIGTGTHGGVGPGNGPGVGPGWNGGHGGEAYTAGIGGVTEPVPIFTPEAEFSDEARRQKYQGVCSISVIIDPQGNPQSPRVVQRLGMGLDEKALEAVMRYRFKPAKKDGHPVAVRMTVLVDFRLY